MNDNIKNNADDKEIERLSKKHEELKTKTIEICENYIKKTDGQLAMTNEDLQEDEVVIGEMKELVVFLVKATKEKRSDTLIKKIIDAIVHLHMISICKRRFQINYIALLEKKIAPKFTYVFKNPMKKTSKKKTD